jgi:hypothetical protein
MGIGKGKSVTQRLLAVVLAFAFISTGILGLACHASHAAGTHTHSNATEAASPVPLPDAASPSELHSDHQKQAPSNHHADFCPDLICHSTLAVLPTVDGLALDPPTTISLMPKDFGGTGSVPAPLDRPPLAFRS